MNIWLHNPELASNASLIASLLVLGQVLLAYQIMPFNLALARGITKINIILGFIGIIVLIPITIYMVKLFGLKGAALTWLTYNLVLSPLYILLVIRKALPAIGINIKWIMRNVIFPTTVIVFFQYLFLLIKPIFNHLILDFTYIIISTILTIIFSFTLTFQMSLRHSIKYIKNEIFT